MKKTPTPSQNTETRELQERCTRLERALDAVLAAVGVELRIEDLEDVAAPRASDGTGLLEDGDLPVPRRRPQVDPDVAAALRRREDDLPEDPPVQTR